MIKEDFLNALTLSQDMLTSAQGGDWDSFNALDSQRTLILKKYSEGSESEKALNIDKALSLQIEKWVQEIQTINQQIEIIADAEKDSAQSELTQAKKTSKAINAYKQGF